MREEALVPRLNALDQACEARGIMELGARAEGGDVLFPTESLGTTYHSLSWSLIDTLNLSRSWALILADCWDFFSMLN